MTLEEAKKILEKEFAVISLHKSTEPFEFDESGWIEHEKPSVLEAFRVLSKGGYYISISGHDYNMREKRLKKEYEENTKAPGSSENRIKEYSGVNPALKVAASQFNDALLDEQGKKIKRLGKEISRLNGIIHDKNEEIKRKTKGCCELVAENVDLKEDLKNTESLLHDTMEANSRNLDTCFKNEDLIDELKKKLAENTKLAKKYAKELSDSSLGLCKLEKQLKDKNAVLSDVAEDLRLTKIREKNLAELGLKYVGENEKLKKKLADKVVDKIDAQALKSAESALAYKEKVIAEKDEVIDKLTKENNDYKKVVEEFRNKIADMTIGKIEIQNIRLKEKDEVIGDLGKELAATKKELEEKTKLVETVRKGSKEYCEYGIAAEKMIRKMANVIVYEGKVSSKEFEEYRRWANGYRFNPQLYDFIEEEEKKFSPVKDTHPTEDNPEEIEIEKAVKIVRKAMKEGHTVTIKYEN
jgi:chromosome segregation ATPase